MPSSLEAPVLQVDANVIHKVDTSNPQNLFSMWTVFARCSGSVAQGRRLENLSWRLWTRETFCVEAAAERLSSSAPLAPLSSTSCARLSKPKAIPQRSQPSSDDVPQLSGSVESVPDEETVELASESDPVEIMRPRIRRQDSCGSNRSRGRERHITSGDLEKMVVSIVQEKEPLKGPLPDISPLSYPLPQAGPLAQLSKPVRLSKSVPATSPPSSSIATPAAPVATQPTVAPEQTVIPAEKTVAASHCSQLPSLTEEKTIATSAPVLPKNTTTVIRGFSPSHSHFPVVLQTKVVTAPTQLASQADDEDAIPEPTSSPPATHVQSKKATFALGGSSSCEDSMSSPSRSLDLHGKAIAQAMKRKAAAASTTGAATGASTAVPSSPIASQKKQTSFSNIVMTRTIPSATAAHDDDASESDDIDESAIDDDDDDSSEWEDSNEESGRSSMDDKTMFQRVDSTVHLPSRRSLITLMIQRSEREVRNGLTTSQSTMALPRTRTAHQPPLVASPNDSDDAALMMRHRPRGPHSNLRPINEIPRSAAQPIMSTATGGHFQAALSPRTNRRNMLSTELTESLRRHLLWERSQKTQTANAVLKRRHTSQDVANLRQYPEPVHLDKSNDANASSWDQYLNRDAFNGYHAKGW